MSQPWLNPQNLSLSPPPALSPFIKYSHLGEVASLPSFQFQALWKVTSLSPEILQIAGTFLLLLCVSAVGDGRNAGVPPGLAPLYAGLAVLNIGLWDDGERTTGAGGCHGTFKFC